MQPQSEVCEGNNDTTVKWEQPLTIGDSFGQARRCPRLPTSRMIINALFKATVSAKK